MIPEHEIATEDLRDVLRNAATAGPLRGMLDVFEDEWTSARVVGDPHSSIVDLPLTQSFNGMVSVAAWYDNEAGFSMRLAETAAHLASTERPCPRMSLLAWESFLRRKLTSPCKVADTVGRGTTVAVPDLAGSPDSG